MKLTATQLRRIIKEEVEAMMPPAGGKDPQRFLHGFESGHPMDDEGYMVKSRMSDVKDMAETICGLIEMGDQLPAWVQDLVASAHTDLEHVKDYLEGDEKLRAYDKGSMPSMGESRRLREKQDLNKDGEHDFEDVMIARMKASGMDSEEALKKGETAAKKSKKNESRRRTSSRLSEAHARITPSEFEQWKRGNWGFVSEADESAPIMMSCAECGAEYTAPPDAAEESMVVGRGEELTAECPECGTYNTNPLDKY
jgi:hypothetical protein